MEGVYDWPDQDQLPLPPPTEFSAEELEAMKHPVNEAAWNAVAGRYQFKEHSVEISLLGGKTFVLSDKRDRFELVPLTENMGSYVSSESGPGIIRFKRTGGIVKGAHLFGADHSRIED